VEVVEEGREELRQVGAPIETRMLTATRKTTAISSTLVVGVVM
jgi:hypothetical protein